MTGKRRKQIQENLDRTQRYPIREALEAIKQNANAKFDETIEMAANLGIDPKKADQQVRGTVSLPHGTGKTVRVVVFAEGEAAEEATEAGADRVGSDELAKDIQEGFLDFDIAIATPDMMRVVGKLGKILGPRGLMPNPKTGTVTPDVSKAVQEFKAGRLEYRADKQGTVHMPVGKASFSIEQLEENLRTLLTTLQRVKPTSAKGTYFKSIYITSTMGPSVRLDPDSLREVARAA